MERLWDEIAFLGYYLHWDMDELLSLNHTDRQKWCAKVSEINRASAGAGDSGNPFEI